MDIYPLGLTSFRLKGKKTTIVIDPFDPTKTGLKTEKVEADAVLLSEKKNPYTSLDSVSNYRVVLDGAGEYEVGGVSIYGTTCDDSTVFTVKIDNVTILHLGKIKKMPNDTFIENASGADVVLVPVGGHEHSINAKDAAALIAKLEASIVIPMFFAQPKSAIELDDVSLFLNEIGKSDTTAQSKLSITKEKVPTELQVVYLA